jgi:hypothetical protein
MARPTTAGKKPGAQATTDDLRAIMAGQMGEANMQPGAFGFGKKEHCSPIGPFRACWSKVDLSGVSTTVAVPHNLGKKAIFCTLMDVEVPEGASPPPHVTATPVNRNKWTETECVVDIQFAPGSLLNVIAWFWVGGE